MHSHRYKRVRYRVFIKFCVFFLFCDFFNSASSTAALVFYLPGVCVHTLTARENRERSESGMFLKNRKKTQYLMNTLYIAEISYERWTNAFAMCEATFIFSFVGLSYSGISEHEETYIDKGIPFDVTLPLDWQGSFLSLLRI